MKIRKRKKQKLLVQAITVVLPIFLLMLAAVIWAIYTSSVDGYLEAQKKMVDAKQYNIIELLDVHNKNKKTDDISGTFLECLMDLPEHVPLKTTDEEIERMVEWLGDEDYGTESWLRRVPKDAAQLLVKEELYALAYTFLHSPAVNGFSSLGILDVENPDRYRVLFNYASDFETAETQGSREFDILKHPALQKAIEENSKDPVFELTSDQYADGNYYIGYIPMFSGGKIRAFIGLIYDWDDMKNSITETMIRTALIIVGGMILLMLLILQFLYRRTIKPVTDIEQALNSYSTDKSSKMVVKKMYAIKENNEIGYLADIISDFALELDLNAKEKLRIAVERERAETERARAEKEAYEAKVAVMASQIRPHFMYNALTSIAMMCQINPETAQEATITFAKYLRGNMDSLKQTVPVSFETELEHLRQYLYIEKLRFGKKLNIVYDIQTTDFKIPMLSVQPLVENAVKHGVGMKKKGGTVTVTARETDTAFEVIIADDGVGFDTAAKPAEDGRSHIGMETTRSRLKEMCGGEIRIESKVGEGTTAVITLPKEEQNHEDPVS